MDLPDTSAMTELIWWITGREDDLEKARAAADRLHAAIAKDVVDAEHLRLRAEATNAALVDEMRRESIADGDMLDMVMKFAKGRGDDTGRRIYLAIRRFYVERELGDREPGLMRIPPELAEPAPPIFASKPRQQEAA